MIPITNDIFDSYFDCPYKSYLIANKIIGKKHDLDKYAANRIQKLKKTFNSKITGNIYRNHFNAISFDILQKGYDYIFDARFVTNEIDFRCDFLEKVESTSKLGHFSYIPILINSSEANIPSKNKIQTIGIVDILNKIQEGYINKGKIVYGNLNTTTVKTVNYIKEYFKVLKIIKSNTAPAIFLNKNCSICQFHELCNEKALKDDNLSLLGGIPKKRIENLNKKGIFTITQLSYTFRPRRKANISNKRFKTRSFELQALSIRENKVHILGEPTIITTNIKIFLDIEGIPDRNFYYLIGLTLVDENNSINHQYFWIKDKLEEPQKLEAFINNILAYKEFTVYHFGNYEIQAFQKFQKDYPQFHQEINKIISNSVNILSILYNNIYFPTYTNSLKDVSAYIGFKWSNVKASGLQSIYWRLKWEQTGLHKFKDTLITYNHEDCMALYTLFLVLISIMENKSYNSSNHSISAVEANKIENDYSYSFLANATIIPEMKIVNKCSYFDYQKEKVFARTDKRLEKNIEKQKIKKKSHYHIFPDSIIDIMAKCPFCKSVNFEQQKYLSKKIADLKFSEIGVCRNIVQYNSGKYLCLECRQIYIPTEYQNLKLRIGHNLIAWTIYQNISQNAGFRRIEESLLEIFGLYISRTTLFWCKRYFVEYYQPTYEELVNKVLTKNIIYADETPFSMQFEIGYVWVFTNNEDVISFYKPTREGSFLEDFLKSFKGVLVTDFYQAYDKLECSQQKCLIHLMRDLNADLVKNPFNEEFKKITKDFTLLLQSIVSSIDSHGLKHSALKKHIVDAEKFIANMLKSNLKTEIAIHYQKRIEKYRDNLFEFLKHDSVSWNNSNAEHAIRLLAIHANKNMTVFRASRIDDYLKIFSIFQSCDFRNISFLKFMLSKNKSIESYIESLT